MKSTGPSSSVVEAILERAQYSCEACGSLVGDRRGEDWSVQHRLPRRMGGTRWRGVNLPSNLMILCGSAVTGCHGFAESKRAAALAAGWLLSSNPDPTTTPALVCKRWVLLTNEATYKEVGRVDA